MRYLIASSATALLLHTGFAVADAAQVIAVSKKAFSSKAFSSKGTCPRRYPIACSSAALLLHMQLKTVGQCVLCLLPPAAACRDVLPGG